MDKTIGERIRILRVSKSLSQENIANELNLSVSAYSNIERGKTEISVSRLYHISKILKTTPAFLLNIGLDNSASSATTEASNRYETVQKRLSDLAEKIDDFQRIVLVQKKEISYLEEIIQLLKKKEKKKK